MKLKFLYPLVGLTGGIFLDAQFDLGYWFPLISLALALGCWLTISIISKNPLRGRKFSALHSVWICLLFASIGSLDFLVSSKSFTEKEIDGQQVFIKGEIKDISYLTNGDRFKISIKSLCDSSGATINCRNLNLLLRTDGFVGSKGDIISFKAVPSRIISGDFNPDYKKNMWRQGIEYESKVKFVNIEKIGEAHSLSKVFSELREDLTILLEKSSLNRATAEFINSIILGDKTFLSSKTRQTLTSAGLAHVLALSGMHVAIILSFLLLLFYPLSLMGLHKSRRLLAIVFLWIYVVVTGASPSTIRAAIMATCVVGAILLERKNSAMNALLGAVMIILLIDPLSLWNIGLQLSFLCVASILLFTQKLNTIDHHSHPKTYKLVNAILITLITTLSTWILVAYYFHNVPFLFLPANLLLLPFLPIYVATGLIYLFFLVMGIDIGWLAKCLDLFSQGFVGAADLLSLSGNANITFHVPLLSVILWLVAILLVAFILHSNVKKFKPALWSLTALTILGSCVFMITYEDSVTQKLKFNHSFTKMEAAIINSDGYTSFIFPRRSISSVSTSDFHILAIDRKIKEDTMTGIDNIGNSTRYLFIGPEADLEQVSHIISNHNIEKIILHAGIGKNKKEDLLSLLNESFWDKIHPLRDYGSLELDL